MGAVAVVNGRIFCAEGFLESDLLLDDGCVQRWADRGGLDIPPGAQVVDAAGAIVAPGLIDVHFHGAMGADLCDGTPESLAAIARYEAHRGITAICPATMSYSEEILDGVLANAAAFVPADDESALVGINMEGPYISPNKVGAQNPLYVRPGTVEEFFRLQECARGLIRIVDVAPEIPGALQLIEELSESVRVSVAHTEADYDQAKEAFDAGARQVTHLFNAMPGLNHRKPGPIAAAWEDARVTPELIADGVHIHPAMVRLAFALFGSERMVLVSDTMRACGLDDGEYDLGGQRVSVTGSRAALADGTLAGSVTDLAGCLKTAVVSMGIPVHDALQAACANPARILGLEGVRGTLAPGAVADAVVFNGAMDPVTVILRGRVLS